MNSPNENGDIESSNGGFKRAVTQHLLLRGSRDFESLETYEAFLWGVMEKRNAGRQVKLAEELAVIKPLTVAAWPAVRELSVRVGTNRILRVGSNGYTVPSGLKGKRVMVKVFEWQIEVWYANQRVETLPRQTGVQHYRINYRHVIDSLLRKPGGSKLSLSRRFVPPGGLPPGLGGAPGTLFSPQSGSYLPAHPKLAAGGLETDVAAALEILLDIREELGRTVGSRIGSTDPASYS